MESIKMLVIVGPTASGKTSLAIELAKKFDGEIICADSRTVYRGMDIGTAKPTKSEQEGVPHHLLDLVNPDEQFTVADFKQLTDEAILDIQKRGKLPILVGGSGLYVDAVIYNYQFSKKGAKKDTINPRHLDKSVSSNKDELKDDVLVVGLQPSLEDIKKNITERVDLMVEQGLSNEVKRLYDIYPASIKALQAPGYKAFKDYIENKISLDDAKEQFIKNDYLLARRQRTWFKRNKSIHWFDNRDNAVEFVTTVLNKKQ